MFLGVTECNDTLSVILLSNNNNFIGQLSADSFHFANVLLRHSAAT